MGHSFSRDYFTRKFELLGLAGECRYLNFELDSLDHLSAIFDKYPDLEGFNVTIPFKREVMAYLDFVSPEAAEIGAVNCVVVRDGLLRGYNTDAYGFGVGLDLLLGSDISVPIPDFSSPDFGTKPASSGLPSQNSSGPCPPLGGPMTSCLATRYDGLRALLLGNGGAAAAVKWVLRQRGIDFSVVSRGGELNYDNLTPEILADRRLIINATPLGTFPDVEARPEIDYGAIGEGYFLYDLVYNPPLTAFMAEGERRGARVINGRVMLEAQAERNWAVWNK